MGEACARDRQQRPAGDAFKATAEWPKAMKAFVDLISLLLVDGAPRVATSTDIEEPPWVRVFGAYG